MKESAQNWVETERLRNPRCTALMFKTWLRYRPMNFASKIKLWSLCVESACSMRGLWDKVFLG